MKIESVHFRSRIGRRIVALFVACALLPLGLVTAYSAHELTDALERRADEELASTARSFGLLLIGRMNGARDVLEALAETADGDRAWLAGQLLQTDWARKVEVVRSFDGAGSDGHPLPAPDAQQRAALDDGRTTLLWSQDGTATPRVYFARAAPGDGWLVVQLQPAWLWDGAAEYAGANALAVVAADGQRLLSTRERVPGSAANGPPTEWQLQSWQAFLNAAYAAPSWQVLAYRERQPALLQVGAAREMFPAILLLTILLVTLISMSQVRRTLDPLERLIEGTRRLQLREFDTRVRVAGNDEFATLARSFNGMADNLRAQFTALETLAEIDRLLLRSPGLEEILDSVLPRIAAILGARSVSVMLLDPAVPDHARMYDHRSDQPSAQPVRRVTIDHAAMRQACAAAAPARVAGARADGYPFLTLLQQSGAEEFELWPLSHDEAFAGLLCLGFAAQREIAGSPVIQGRDFADRLSVVLANIARTERLYHQANFDSLTRLPNRQVLRERLHALIGDPAAGRRGGAVLYIDLDHFKHVNDSAGHTAGDELLKVIARRLESCVTADATVARLGGDEFAVLLPEVTDVVSVRRVADRLLAAVRQTVVIGGREHHVAASIGITCYPLDGQSVEELLKNGDIAMYCAKESGRGRAVFFESRMQEELRQRAAVESGLYRAFQHEAFEVVYQPIVASGSHATTGVEALLRWPDRGGPTGNPAQFISVAEQCGLIVGLGEWVLRRACRQFCAWREQGLPLEYVSVNASVRQLKEADFLAKVLDILDACGMPPQALQIEITESVLAEGSELETSLLELAGRGIRLALDDFGTGYSSLSYLRTYPIHTVKIDKSFVADLPANPASARLVESIVGMSRALRKHVVAEGVESEGQRRFLEEQGCGSMQGYLFGKPMSADELSRHLAWSAARMAGSRAANVA